MATDRAFVDYIAEQAGLGDSLTFKRMFGEYGMYLDDKVIGFVCDNSLFIKPAEATAPLTRDLPLRPPYPGAKGYPVADELLDNTDTLKALLLATERALPAAKPKKPRATKATAKAPARPRKKPTS